MSRRTLIGLIIVLSASLFVSAACKAAPEDQGNERGDELMVCCCLGDYSVAEEYAKRMQEAVPGSAVRIGAREIKEDSGRMVFEIYLSHQDYTPEQLGERLAEYNCPTAVKSD
jgi:hypothetical protein